MTKRVVDLEQYFTPANVVAECLKLVESVSPLSSFELVIEPSAGRGAFLLELDPKNRLGLDLDPQHEEIVACDFLTWKAPSIPSDRVAIIGNPPFGQRGALAMKFLKRACQLSDFVGFILPLSFRKYTFQDRVPTSHHLVLEVPLSVPFITKDGAMEVKTVFQIWRRGNSSREIQKRRAVHQDFSMKHAHLSRISLNELNELRQWADFAIPQVGANFKPRECSGLSKGSYWFIKGKHPDVRRAFENADFDFLENMNTAHTSLSKSDIVYAYERASGVQAIQIPTLFEV